MPLQRIPSLRSGFSLMEVVLSLTVLALAFLVSLSLLRGQVRPWERKALVQDLPAVMHAIDTWCAQSFTGAPAEMIAFCEMKDSSLHWQVRTSGSALPSDVVGPLAGVDISPVAVPGEHGLLQACQVRVYWLRPGQTLEEVQDAFTQARKGEPLAVYPRWIETGKDALVSH